MAFGLEHLVALYQPQLADGAVHRAHKWCIRQRSRVSFQSAGEKIIETRVVADVGVGRLAHVHLVCRDKPFNDGVRDATSAPIGYPTSKRGERELGHQVLQCYE